MTAANCQKKSARRGRPAPRRGGRPGVAGGRVEGGAAKGPGYLSQNGPAESRRAKNNYMFSGPRRLQPRETTCEEGSPPAQAARREARLSSRPQG